MTKRKVYQPQFKAKIGLEAIKEVKTVNEIAREHEIHPVQVGNWKRVIREGAPSLFETKRGRKKADETSDPDRLYSEIGRLKMELDWLKKKSGVSP